MEEKIRAALLQDKQARLQPFLQEALRFQEIEAHPVASRAEAHNLMASSNPPELFLTDLEFEDGTWEDVVRMSGSATLPVNVIVVSRLADMRLYMEALQVGAFDFISPPFHAPELAYLLRNASANARLRRKEIPIRLHPQNSDETQATLAFAS